jgi:hypothetical protein
VHFSPCEDTRIERQVRDCEPVFDNDNLLARVRNKSNKTILETLKQRLQHRRWHKRLTYPAPLSLDSHVPSVPCSCKHTHGTHRLHLPAPFARVADTAECARLEEQHGVGDELGGEARGAAGYAAKDVRADGIAAAAKKTDDEQLGVACGRDETIADTRAAVEGGGRAFTQLQGEGRVSNAEVGGAAGSGECERWYMQRIDAAAALSVLQNDQE